MMTTRTGNFPIGFRRMSFSPWHKDPAALAAWAKAHQFSVIDLGRDADTAAKPFQDAGLSVGSADLPEWQGMISATAQTRAAAVAKNAAYIRACVALGITRFFAVMLPEKHDAPRKESFAQMIDSLNALAGTLDETGAKLVIEGWPGPGALCCTPETVRATIKACSSRNVGLNFDPSHLLRMNIDPLRFLEEFVGRVFHVHGKDCEVLTENLYEYGSEQTPVFGKPREFGWITWRYCIPGHGNFRWTRALELLASHQYRGAISVELEDENFNGSERGEQEGLIAASHFLRIC
jgi:sugar phosphate isomerase/epimerase